MQRSIRRFLSRTWLGAGLLLVSVAPVHANELPALNLTQSCARRSTGSAAVAMCLRQEDDAKRALTSRWNTYPEHRRHFCVQELGLQRQAERSYTALSKCLDDASTS